MPNDKDKKVAEARKRVKEAQIRALGIIPTHNLGFGIGTNSLGNGGRTPATFAAPHPKPDDKKNNDN